jgi:hypothetical protein
MRKFGRKEGVVGERFLQCSAATSCRPWTETRSGDCGAGYETPVPVSIPVGVYAV